VGNHSLFMVRCALMLKYPRIAATALSATMRKLHSQQLRDNDMQRALDEFSDRMSEYGIAESDVVSISIMPAPEDLRPLDTGFEFSPMRYQIVLVYWSGE
jgi:hypothetical protein